MFKIGVLIYMLIGVLVFMLYEWLYDSEEGASIVIVPILWPAVLILMIAENK